LEIATSLSSKFDTLTLETEVDAGIEAVRKILENLSRKPFNSSFTSVIVLEAQNLTIEAQSALLKTLEEPAASNQIILTCPSPYSVLPTISSRCQQIDLGTTKPTEKNYENLNKATLGERIILAETLDLESWEAFWRKKLHEAIGKKELAEIATYLHQIKKAKEFLGKRANQKLVKINLIFDIPKIG